METFRVGLAKALLKPIQDKRTAWVAGQKVLGCVAITRPRHSSRNSKRASVGIWAWQQARNSAHTVGRSAGFSDRVYGAAGELAISGSPLHAHALACLGSHLASKRGLWHEHWERSNLQARCVHGKSEAGDCNCVASLRDERLSACCVSVSPSFPCTDPRCSPKCCSSPQACAGHRLELAHGISCNLSRGGLRATLKRTFRRGEISTLRAALGALARHTNEPGEVVQQVQVSEQHVLARLGPMA